MYCTAVWQSSVDRRGVMSASCPQYVSYFVDLSNFVALLPRPSNTAVHSSICPSNLSHSPSNHPKMGVSVALTALVIAFVALTALVIAFVALFVALLQVAQQYASSSEARGKVNTAAIGRWSRKNKYRWSFWEWKLRVRYARPVLTSDMAMDMISAQENLRSERLPSIPNVAVTRRTHLSDGRNGPQISAPPKLIFTRRDAEDQNEIPLEELPRRHRRIAKAVEKEMAREYLPSVPCKASWCNLMNDIGLDPEAVPSTEMLDADLIISSLDAPTMQIRLSDLIDFGLLLGMKVVEVDEDNHVLTMTGRHCSITTRYCEGVGQLSRYSGMAPQIQPIVRAANPQELRTAMRTATGVLQLGDSFALVPDWGYNSIDLVLGTALGKAEGEDWKKISIKDTMALVEADSDIKWGGKWRHPKTSSLRCSFALFSNVAVVNAFPHVLLHGWTIEERNAACLAAIDEIHRSVEFIEAPQRLFHTIRENGIDILVMDYFKAANNYGCEYGGLRGWLSTNHAVFTARLARCWPVDHITERVPILPRLYAALKEAALQPEWCKTYDQAHVAVEGKTGKGDEGPGWRMTANSLLWMQITMLDTWIGRKADLMTGRVSDEVAVPADLVTATTQSNISMQRPQTTAWKKSRMEFARAYLSRLAEGADGKAVSCMSMGVGDGVAQPTLGPAGWENMAFGKPEDWAAMDAVLTLRSMLMVTRFEIMNDSSVLLRLRHFNPVVLLA
ncbi:hypothetical protein JAAARDRAFT_585454 [Jaapia argillacea MUCL 33604]|uniref:Uncharacterized protein n=1 Tax=Jaapia argillacea MUCL 33604 TaxID=933084 RepID=A0A067P9J0_9AGAM|nr:hypothetical protein JAAARDRAFT_585454 [Jaapia argillacea MUCL 33604]